MASKATAAQISKITLASTDLEFINLAQGALPNSTSQAMTVMQQSIAEVATSIREIDADIIILDIDTSRVEDFESLQKIKRMVGTETSIIVISGNFSPAAARILLQLKVADFLVKPVQTSDLVRSCNNALKKNNSDAQLAPQFLTFMPASGGVGTTTLTIETASLLHSASQSSGRTTCIVDLNIQHGSCAEYLDIEPRFDISEIENAPERLDRQLLDVMLSKHSTGLSLISAPNSPTEMRSFKGALVVKLLDLVSAYFDNVVIDLPRIWFPWTETVLAGSDRVFVIADMTVPSVRHGNRLVHSINERVGKQANAKVIVNRMDYRKNNSGLNAEDVKEALGAHYGGSVPNNYALARDAVDRGVTLGEIEQNNNVSQALKQIIFAGENQNEEVHQEKGGLFALGRNLLKRKAG